ncbi:PstS family phosphate ABC transporter substrate-binding protein [Alkalicoccus chagannorensis]|uniref:PstS family phosphate ABC transporter substrate-binding protein n=1 Tax=Alkalicoccus chagannorensis TaxID=427072 RepID=UPI00041CBF4C|nr:substrate-binding domain-containing protein [Alkalicoccus chagannorensis]
MTMVTKTAALILAAGVAAFAAFVGAFLLSVFELHPAWMTMLLTAAVVFTAVVALLLFVQIDKPGRKKIYTASMLLVLLAGGGSAAWEWATPDPEMAEGRGVDLHTYEPFAGNGAIAQLEDNASLEMDEPIRLDGATALYPIYAAFTEAVFPEGEYDPYETLQSDVVSTQTDEAYERLVTNQTDMIFAAGPSEEQQAYAEEFGVELQKTPIGKEAFVFFTHSDNSVDDLTVEEIQQIYAGEITNWEEVGGNDAEIRAFQRPEGSGSQTALIDLMDGTPVMEPPSDDVQQGMGGVIQETSNYRNHQSALGYSFRYYTKEMAESGDIELLQLNGVEPDEETIRSGAYPVTDYFYAVTRKADHGEKEVTLIDWILSEEGQYIIEESGYIAAAEEEEE